MGNTPAKYQTPVIYELGKRVRNEPDLDGQTFTGFFLESPNKLPPGLKLDSVTGTIFGTPTTLSPPTLYIITGTFGSFPGYVNSEVMITVGAPSDATLHYNSPYNRRQRCIQKKKKLKTDDPLCFLK